MKVFVDTNILIDFLASREKFYDDAKRIFALGLLHKQQLVISALSVVNTMYVAHKYGYANVRKGLQGLFNFRSVIDYRSNYVKEALDLNGKTMRTQRSFCRLRTMVATV